MEIGNWSLEIYSMFTFGFDIGASRLKAALVKETKIIKSEQADLPNNLADLLVLMEKIFKAMTADDGVAPAGLGVSVPGFKYAAAEELFRVSHIEYLDNQPLQKIFAEKFQLHPVRVAHDAHCFLLAEKKTGLAQNFKNVFYLTLGSSIGGAALVDGQLFFGAHGSAGEIAHTLINIDPPFELETVASNIFIVKNLGAGSVEGGQLARAGDEKALAVFNQLGQNLGVVIANIINLLDPEAVILSGGIAENENLLRPGIKEGMEKFVISPVARSTPILFSQLGSFGGALGAALLVQEN